MSETTTIVAKTRTSLGTANARRVRRAGLVPANVYGMKKPPVSVAVESGAITPLIVAGSHVLDLDLDGQISKVMIREIQYDTLFTCVTHVDFQRIDPNARSDVDVEIGIKGQIVAGVLDQPIHKISLNCLAYRVPEKLYVRVNSLKIGDHITVAQLDLPEGAKAALAGDAIVVRVQAPQEVDLTAGGAEGAEPEVIGRKKTEDEKPAK
jgi:large subunit ribosomal protein L25